MEQTLFETITDQNTYYVFPTEIAASSWADRILCISDIGSIAMERFMAWDTFKAQAVRSQQQDKKSIPSVLRKMFVQQLIEENAERCRSGQKPVFESLVNPRYAEQALSFSDWIAKLLPPLASWYRAYTGGGDVRSAGVADTHGSVYPADGEDRDLVTIALRYQAFLDEHGLFEPAWERPPFRSDGHTYIVFFPSILEDFSEYEQILLDAPHVRFVDIPDCCRTDRIAVCRFANARCELDALVHTLQELHDAGIAWQDILVSVPDIQTYAPYIERQCSLYAIPCAVRAGQTLASYGAGRFFSLAAQCVRSRFSFASLKSLLLDKNLPWKEPDVIDQLMEFGRKHNCLCSWNEQGRTADIWEKAFASAGGAREERAHVFYTQLAAQLKALVRAPSFAALQTEYWKFRGAFFDMDRCSDITDKTLARCIAELTSLAGVSESFGVRVPDSYAFFTEHLAGKVYTPQQERGGVAIVSYRTAAAACAGVHIVIDASQRGITVLQRPLSFLRQLKREKLKLEDRDVSLDFAALYRLNSLYSAAYFSFSEQGYGEYSVPYSQFAVVEPEQKCSDLYEKEQRWYTADDAVFPERLFSVQKAGFCNWASDTAGEGSAGSLRRYIEQKLFSEKDGKRRVRISATALKTFSVCPIQWVYEYLLRLDDYDADAKLVSDNVAGLIYHAALNRFFSAVRAGGQRIAAPLCEGLSAEYERFIADAVDEVIDGAVQTHRIADKELSVIGADLIEAKRQVCKTILKDTLTVFTEQFKGYAVAETEQPYTALPPAAESSFYYYGVIDLVLLNTEYEPVIIDFKTSGTPALKYCSCGEGNELRDYQIALYTYLFEQSYRNLHPEKQPVQAAQALFWSIHGQKASFVFDEKKTRDEFELTLDALHEKAACFAAAAETAGAFTARGTAFADCAVCRFRHICRSVYAVSGRRREGLCI